MKKVKIITHNGGFHSDEVFAVATLSLLYQGKIEVVRTRDIALMETGDIVVDVGGEYDTFRKKFDHHQHGGAGKRENGIPYASFGLIWKEFGEKVCESTEVFNVIDKKIVQAIDALDNGVEISKSIYDDVHHYSIFDIVSAFAPSWKEPEGSIDNAFLEVVLFAEKILQREIKKNNDKIEGEKFVIDAYNLATEKTVVVLDREYSWGDILSKFPEPLFVVEPVWQNNTWRVKSVRNDKYSFKNRKDFPMSWAGLRDGELARVSGVSDAVFCHNKLFIAVAKSREGAIALAKIALLS